MYPLILISIMEDHSNSLVFVNIKEVSETESHGFEFNKVRNSNGSLSIPLRA